MKSKVILWVIISIFAFSSLVYADIPQMINYQGKITTPAGALVDTTIQMIFTIYDDSTSGNVLWADSQSTVVVEKGIFSVLLGSVNPIPDSVFPGDVRYLGVKVGADPEMTPRKAIVSVGYAYRAEYADTAQYAHVGDDDWEPDTSGFNIYRLTGNVGIGTPTPTEKLDVQGDVNTSGVYKIGGNRVLSIPSLDNTFVGLHAGGNNTTGEMNTFLGNNAGYNNTTGNANVFLGMSAGESNTTGRWNTFLGHNTGISNSTGIANTYLGYAAGHSCSGSTNVFIGHKAGYNETGSNKLYIANGPDDSDVLIYGDFSTGNVGIGTATPTEKLYVQKNSNAFEHLISLKNSSAGSQAATAININNDEGSGLALGRLGSGNNTFPGYGGPSESFLYVGHSGKAFNLVVPDDVDGKLNFFVGTTAEGTPKMVINKAGNVGIGMTNPQGALDVNSTTGALIVPRMTTAQRDALSAVNGMIIYNTTTNQFNFYENGAWVTK